MSSSLGRCIAMAMASAAILLVAACDSSSNTPAAAEGGPFPEGGTTGDSASPPLDDGGGGDAAAGCAVGETPPGPARSSTKILVSGWHLKGSYSAATGMITDETVDCEQRKGFLITAISGSVTPTEKEIDDTACALSRGVLLPMGPFGVNTSAPNPNNCVTIPCSPGKQGLLWDSSADTGLIYAINSDGARGTLQGKAKLVNGRLVLANPSGPAYEPSGNVFSCQ